MLRKNLIVVALALVLGILPSFGKGKPLHIEVVAGYVNSLESIKAEYDGGADQYLSGNFGGVFAGAGILATPFGDESFFLSADFAFKYLSGLLHDRAARESYVFAPIRLGYNFEVVSFGLEDNLCLEPYIGPVFQYGLTSKTNDYDFYNPDGQLKSERFNVLFGGGIKAVLNRRFVLDFGYDFGLIPRFDKKGDTYSYHWSCSTLHVGLNYRF